MFKTIVYRGPFALIRVEEIPFHRGTPVKVPVKVADDLLRDRATFEEAPPVLPAAPVLVTKKK